MVSLHPKPLQFTTIPANFRKYTKKFCYQTRVVEDIPGHFTPKIFCALAKRIPQPQNFEFTFRFCAATVPIMRPERFDANEKTQKRTNRSRWTRATRILRCDHWLVAETVESVRGLPMDGRRASSWTTTAAPRTWNPFWKWKESDRPADRRRDGDVRLWTGGRLCDRVAVKSKN